MPSLHAGYLEGLRFNTQQAAALRRLGESRGKQQLFLRQVPQQLESLRQSAIIESTESSSRIEGVTAPHGRVAELVEKRAAPTNRSEQEIAGYRDALHLIHDSAGEMPFTPNVIRQLHQYLFHYLPTEGGHWKPTDNTIVERDAEGRTVRVRFTAVPAVATPQAMDTLTSDYNRASEERAIDALVLIPLAILDLLCVHPFRDGNGRVARLTTLLLLHKADYEVGRYISLERLVEDSKDAYYATLERSSLGWHESHHDVHPWLDYFWSVLIRAYNEFEERIETLRGSKTDQVREAVSRRAGLFSISDIERDCPGISRDMVRHVLRQMKAERRIEPTGTGRSAKWRHRGRALDTPSTEDDVSNGPAPTIKGHSNSIDAQLRLAIANKRLIRFRYHGSDRVAEPHDYGVNNGVTRLLVYQLRGPARSTRGSATGWRLLDVSKLEDCFALDDTFPGSRGPAHRQHLGWEILHARVG